MSRNKMRKKPTAQKPIVAKPKKEKPVEESKGRKFAKALKKRSDTMIGAAPPPSSDNAAAELTNIRLTNERTTPGKAQSIIKKRRV